MQDVHAAAGQLRVIFHNDDVTTEDFVIELLRSVFMKSAAEAAKLARLTGADGQANCGSYPRDVANLMIDTARQRIRLAGHPLQITSEPVGDIDGGCKLCGGLYGANRLSLKGGATLICDACMHEIMDSLPELTRSKPFDYACEALAWHFAGIPHDQLTATSRQFPGHMRADVQVAVDRLFSASPIRFFGIHERHRYETLTIATLTRDDRDAPAIAPAQYLDVDVGDSAPVRCLHNGLWLCQIDGLRYAVVLSSHR